MRNTPRQRGALAMLALAALLIADPAMAQEPATYTIFGRVRDAATGAPLAGAQVVVEGTDFGALADNRGAYSIAARLAPGQYTIQAQMIGREPATRQVTLGAERTVAVPDILLRETALALEEVVVTGTAAPTQRRALGNAVATVEGEKLSETPAVTIDQALQGKVPGAIITSNTGTPGGGVSVRLRGTSSIIGGAEPLYIVDGVIIDNNADQQINLGYRSNASNRLADLDPDDIERVEILKGAAAAALYGSRANNGVVQIFTKRGQAGAPKITAATRFTRSDLENEIDFALTPVDTEGKTVERFDHQDLLFRDVWSHDQYVSLSGGDEGTRYYTSASWVEQNGIMRGSDHEKLNVRLNLDQRLGTWFDLGAGANYVRSHSDLVINGEAGFGGLLTAIVFTPTTVDLAERDPITGELVNKAFVFPNPLEVIENWETPQDISRFVGSLNAKANPIAPLRLDYRLGYDRYEMETALSIPRGRPDAPLGSSTSLNRRSTLLNNDFTGSYDWGVGEGLRMNTSAGVNHTYQRLDQHNLSATDLTPGTRLVRGAVQSASEAKIELVTLGFYGQQQVSWNNRVFLTGALRWDASSTFGADERWQLFPKISGSWVLSEEPFWRDSPAGGWFSELRLRAAYGEAGNQPPLGQAYARVPRLAQTTNVDRLGLVPMGTPGNPDLRPERQREWEAGFDAAFFDERLGLRFTYYDQYTDDLLLFRPFTPSAGYSSILDNVGALSNTGVELELTTVNVDGEGFGWNSRLIYSRNENEVERLDPGVAPFGVGYTNWIEPGQPLGVHRMSAFERDDAGNIVTDSLGPVRAATPQIVGNPWPEWTASLANDFRFGESWSASILFDGQFGHELWNQTQRIMDIFGAGPNFDRQLRGEISRAKLVRHFIIWENYLEDASYVKLRDLTVRYSTGAGWVQNLGVSRLQFELTGRNLYTWTEYTGYDPEINMFGQSTVERGTDFAVYPNPRTIGFGVRLTY